MSSATYDNMVAPMDNEKSLGSSASIASLRSYKVVWCVALIVAVLQAFYASGFISRTSFVVEGQRYFCLFDDAMISMRYGANLAAGNGLVWNVGQRVEGYTTFLWTGVMGACHLLGLSPTQTCLFVQLLGIPILWSCVAGTVLLARSCRLLPLTACCAVMLVGTFYNLIFFTLFGMETGLQTALVTFALAHAANSLYKKQGHLAPMLWFAPAALVRIDVLPVMLLVFVFLFISVRKGRDRLFLGLLVVALVVLVHFLWRHHFYREWLPNTYYLKVTGWPLVSRLTAGIRQTLWTAVTFGLPALLAVVVLLWPKRWHLLLFSSFTLTVAYQIYVGGDAWPLNRFVLPAGPAMFVLAAQGIHRVMKLLMKCKTRVPGTIVRVGMTLICVVAINGIHWDHALLLARPQTTGDNRLNIRSVLAVDRVVEPDASVAVVFAGAFPYFSQRVCIDLLGKCDPYIARLPTHPENSRAGHNKSDFKYSITTYKPDVVLHVFMGTPEFYQDYRPIAVEVDGTEIVFCVRKDSRSVKGGKFVIWQSLFDYIWKANDEVNRDF